MKSSKKVSQGKFNKFAKKIRKKEKVNSDELWPIEKLYKILQNEPGGFILIFDIHSCLGIKIEEVADNIYNIIYRDPFYSNLKVITYNSMTKQTTPKKELKLQWFGKFELFKDKKINPSIKNCATYKYELHLPEDHASVIQQDTFHCGDICAYLATESMITLFDNQVTL